MYRMESIEKWISGGVGIFIAMYKLLEWYKRKRMVKKAENQLKTFINDSKECEALARSITGGNHADRIYIFRSHNSGGIPRLGTPYYTSVSFYDYKDKSLLHRGKKYNNIEVDDMYKDLMLQVIDEHKIELETKSMEDGLLKQIYELEHVQKSIIYRLAITDKEFFYMSVAWFTEPTEDQLIESYLIVNKIQTIYKKHHKQ